MYSTNYNIDIKNAKSGTKIIKKYKDSKKIHPEKTTLVLYDLDGKTTVEDIKKMYRNSGIKLGKHDLYFVNPKIEFLFILWYEKRAYTLVNDDEYQVLIEKIYGIKNYDKHEKQLTKIMEMITYEKVELILEYLEQLKLNGDSKCLPSTNFKDLFNLLFKKKSR